METYREALKALARERRHCLRVVRSSGDAAVRSAAIARLRELNHHAYVLMDCAANLRTAWRDVDTGLLIARAA